MSAQTARKAAAQITALLARETPDLVAGSAAWKTQADLLAGAVGVWWKEHGYAGSSVRRADAIRTELGL